MVKIGGVVYTAFDLVTDTGFKPVCQYPLNIFLFRSESGNTFLFDSSGMNMMNKATLLFLLCGTPLVASAVDIVAPDMELGHWTSTVDQSALIEQMLAQVPPESRAMAKGMMEKQMQASSVTQQCITPKMLSNFDDQMKEAFSAARNCDFAVSESTSEKFVGKMICPGSIINIETNVVNPKRSESIITTEVAGMDKATITSVAEWQSAVCPEGI